MDEVRVSYIGDVSNHQDINIANITTVKCSTKQIEEYIESILAMIYKIEERGEHPKVVIIDSITLAEIKEYFYAKNQQHIHGDNFMGIKLVEHIHFNKFVLEVY